MKNAEATQPLRSNRMDTYSCFLMQLVFNRRPSDIKWHFWWKSYFCPPTWAEIHTYIVVFFWTDL